MRRASDPALEATCAKGRAVASTPRWAAEVQMLRSAGEESERRRRSDSLEDQMESIKDPRGLFEVEHQVEHAARPGFRINETPDIPEPEGPLALPAGSRCGL